MLRKMGRMMMLGGASLLAIPLLGGEATSQPVAPKVPQATAPMAEPATPAERELQQLMQQLNQVGEALLKNVQSPQAWHYQVQQGDLLLQIALRSKAPERERYLKMSIDTYHSAGIQAPETEKNALDRLSYLPGQIRQHFPESSLYSYAALQVVRAQHTREVQAAPAKQAQLQMALVQRLLGFAQEYPRAVEALTSILEAGKICEAQAKNEDACRCYRLVGDRYPGTPEARKARLALRQLGGFDGEPVALRAPLLYPTGGPGTNLFDLADSNGKFVVLYFWSSESPTTAEGFVAVKRLTDRYQFNGLDVVFVNVDSDQTAARDYLQGRLITGTHVVMKDGLKSAFAERFGLEQVPEFFLVSKTGTLLAPALTPAQLEAAVAAHMPGEKRGR